MKQMNTTTREDFFAERMKLIQPSFLREILKVAGTPGMISFAGGLPNPDFFPLQELRECADKVFKERGKQALQYSATEGYLPLREFISQKFYDQHGLSIDPGQILITNGSQQALDIVGKLFLNPGDGVLVERPSYLGALQCFSQYQPKFHEVKLNQDGIDTIALERVLSNHSIKLVYSIPNFQNPTGISYSVEKRLVTARLLSNHSTLLIEDDPYGDISFTDENRLPVYSYLPEQTILLGSFSKTVAPGLRVGWMVAEREIIKKATIVKQASDLHSANLPQYILNEFFKQYDWKKYVQKITMQYQLQKNVMLNCLENYFPRSVEYTKPMGGMFTWLSLPQEITAKTLLQKALEQKIIFVPGDSFYASDPDWQTLRLNYSNVPEASMHNAMCALAGLLK